MIRMIKLIQKVKMNKYQYWKIRLHYQNEQILEKVNEKKKVRARSAADLVLKNLLLKKESEAKNFWSRKIIGKKSWNFFFDFPNFFSVEIFHMMSRLRMQNFPVIGQGVPEIFVRTSDRQTNYFSNIDERKI